MLPGVTSWWTSSSGSPARLRSSWAACSPAAQSAMMRAVLNGSSRGPCRDWRRIADIDSPSRYSIAMKKVPSSSPRS